MLKKIDLEREAIQIILDAGDKGILQSDMWKKLGATSREGSRLALKLEKKGFVERKKVLHKGRWTYKLLSKTKPVTINSINDCPCITCVTIERCFSGGEVSPTTCMQLTFWIDPTAESPVTLKDT